MILILISLYSVLFISQNLVYAQTFAPWSELSRKYRIKLTVTAPVQIVNGTPIETPVDFNQILTSAGQTGAVNTNSLKLVEVNSQGAVVNSSIPFQFDITTGTNGKLVFISSDISVNTAKYYYLYFDTGSSFTLPIFTPQVSLTDNVTYQGQLSYKFITTIGTYYYHKQGAGFASIIDNNNKDWLSYKPTGNFSGNYRGIPNMVHPENLFHPGSTGSGSQIIGQGPLKITINSQSIGGKWIADWEIYPKFARMTLKASDHPYWFLYEGTPNGAFNALTNYMILSNGEKYFANQAWKKDIPSPEWIYFSDNSITRSLFLMNLENDSLMDSYVNGQDSMTVFGFGRDGLNKYMTAIPKRFIVGLAEANVYNDVSQILYSYSQNLQAVKSTLEIHSASLPKVSPTIIPPAGHTIFNLSVFLHGIGKAGDNVSLLSTGNMSPVHTARDVTVQVYDVENQLTASIDSNIFYNQTLGNFIGTIDIGFLESGLYTVSIKVPQYLMRSIPGIVNVIGGQNNNLSEIKLVTGDSNNDNTLSVLDYNYILDCYSELTPPINCSDPSKKLMTDLTDDGSVNQFDYNLFIREISVQSGQ